jgi:hypothetical protein
MAHNFTATGGAGSKTLVLALLLTPALVGSGKAQSALEYSIATPRPISPAEGSTTPSVHPYSTNPAITLRISGYRCGTRVGARRLRNHITRPGRGTADTETDFVCSFITTASERREQLLAFMDCFRVIAWLTLAALPLLVLIGRFKPAGKAPASH